MPTYTFNCEDCDYEQDIFFKFEDYQETIECPRCKGKFTRVWNGLGQAPGIKTVQRMEDVWKKRGLLDPEDPEYKKRNIERVKAMREKDRKRKEREIDQRLSGKLGEFRGRTSEYKPTNKRGKPLPQDEVSKEMKKES